MALAEKQKSTADVLETPFYRDVDEGLSSSPKTLPCKYFYDKYGSQLFEKICATPEYYVTRTECSIYDHYANDMAEYIGPKALLLEPGAGSVKKVALLLKNLSDVAGFLPMDISPEILTHSSNLLGEQFPNLDINPLVVDFSNKAQVQTVLRQLPTRPLVEKRVIFFPGSTIGNFNPQQAEQFLQQFADALLPEDGLLIGVDLIKNKNILEAAYDDASGVTADFNRNLLKRINRELDADFVLPQFQHKAIFNQELSRIEMHLVSQEEQSVRIGTQQYGFKKGETIHTENSYKYSIESFIAVAKAAGFKFEKVWTDADDLFGVFYFQITG